MNIEMFVVALWSHRFQLLGSVMHRWRMQANGPLHDKCVAVHQFKKKHDDICHDNECGDDRKSRRTSRSVAEWYQSSHLNLHSRKVMFVVKHEQFILPKHESSSILLQFGNPTGSDATDAVAAEPAAKMEAMLFSSGSTTSEEERDWCPMRQEAKDLTHRAPAPDRGVSTNE